MTPTTTVELVCPNCGSDDIGTREQAEIWQPARFTLTDGELDIDWDAYGSKDVGDTETVGYFCRACLGTWGEQSDTECPFVPRGTPPTHEWPSY